MTTTTKMKQGARINWTIMLSVLGCTAACCYACGCMWCCMLRCVCTCACMHVCVYMCVYWGAGVCCMPKVILWYCHTRCTNNRICVCIQEQKFSRQEPNGLNIKAAGDHSVLICSFIQGSDLSWWSLLRESSLTDCIITKSVRVEGHAVVWIFLRLSTSAVSASSALKP